MPQPVPAPANQDRTATALPVAIPVATQQATAPAQEPARPMEGFEMPAGYQRERGQAQLVSSLVEALSSHDPRRVTEALRGLGDDSGPAVCDMVGQLLKGANRAQSITLAKTMQAGMESDDAITLLNPAAKTHLVKAYCGQLQSWSQNKRDEAAAALGKLRDAPNHAEAVAALTHIVESRWNPLNWSGRFNPLNLGFMGGHINARTEAANSLAAYGEKALTAVPALTACIGERWSGMGAAAMEALREIARGCKARSVKPDAAIFKGTLAALDKLHAGSKDKDAQHKAATAKKAILEALA